MDLKKPLDYFVLCVQSAQEMVQANREDRSNYAMLGLVYRALVFLIKAAQAPSPAPLEKQRSVSRPEIAL